MKTDKITPVQLFEGQRRYIVPLFQRGYVWKQDEQWEPLWQDILHQVALLEEARRVNTTASLDGKGLSR